jgi:uncharacterized membrane protein YedE/YeeE
MRKFLWFYAFLFSLTLIIGGAIFGIEMLIQFGQTRMAGVIGAAIIANLLLMAMVGEDAPQEIE